MSKVGEVVRAPDGTTWRIIHVEGENVELSGPLPCRGIRSEWLEVVESWEREDG